MLLDVREAVEDWDRCTPRCSRSSTTSHQTRRRWPEEVEEGTALLRWLADDHFTFLGYREYHLESPRASDELLRAVPGTGFGILRADQDMSASFGKLPAMVKAKAREKTLLVLAKANSRATVHRPVYLDYVGVKTFDANGEVVGERRFLGLFSCAAYTESLTRIPVLREKAAAVHRRGSASTRSATPARR